MLKEKTFYKGKRVLVRVDYNVPINNNKIEDNNRILMSLDTINYLIDSGAKIIIMSHLNKIKSEEDKKNNSLYLVSIMLSKLLNKTVKFCSETRGPLLESMIKYLSDGDILLMENTRYEDYPSNLESTCNMDLANYWANSVDEYVFDAFGSIHRLHASTYGVASILGGCTGFLVDKELNKLNEALKEKDKIVILGGIKVNDKLDVIKHLVNNCKKLLLGGAMSFTFLKASGYNIGKSIVENEWLNECAELLHSYKDKIILPLDFVTNNGIKMIEDFKDDDIGFDIGPKTIEYYQSLVNAPLIVWNGPMGKFEDEKYESGTRKLMEYLSINNIKTIICGGDTSNASKKFNINFYYISTGGGASLKYLEGKPLKLLEVLNK